MKKALALLLALVMTLALAACGNKNDQPAQDNNAPSAGEPAATPDPAPAEPSSEEKLLAEIRDLLKEKGNV